jgi:transcriptional repressor NrdR
MRCVKCGHLEDKVVDSREAADGRSIRRRRQCLKCGHRSTTYELFENHELRVVKRNHVREAFDRAKLLRGLQRACEKRPVSADQLEQAVAEIMSELEQDNVREVPTGVIGQKVMEKLRHIDQVAYVRFASVYRAFEDLGEFVDTIDKLRRDRPKTDAEVQPQFFP